MAISIRMIRQRSLLQKLPLSKEFTGTYPSPPERIAVILTSFLICKIESSGMTLAEELCYGITQLRDSSAEDDSAIRRCQSEQLWDAPVVTHATEHGSLPDVSS
jgi:hypothetical protein